MGLQRVVQLLPLGYLLHLQYSRTSIEGTIRMVNNDKSGKSRGYALFQSERDIRGMQGKGRGWG